VTARREFSPLAVAHGDLLSVGEKRRSQVIIGRLGARATTDRVAGCAVLGAALGDRALQGLYRLA